jgi:hypothetical protein
LRLARGDGAAELAAEILERLAVVIDNEALADAQGPNVLVNGHLLAHGLHILLGRGHHVVLLLLLLRLLLHDCGGIGG